MMRSLAFAAVLGLMLAPAANAQVSCGEMSSIMREAGSDFEDISGDEVEADIYEASEQIGGARDCYVDVSLWPIYYCLFQHDHPDTAYSAYGYRLRELRHCLSDWKELPVSEAPPLGGDGYRDLEGMRFIGTDDNEDFEWLVQVEQHIQGGEAHYHVRVELSYF